MKVKAAIEVLRGIDPDDLRPILSDLATMTPGVVYWPKGFLDHIPDKSAGDGSKISAHGQAAMMLANSLSEAVEVGGQAKVEIAGVSHGNEENGDWIITAIRTA